MHEQKLAGKKDTYPSSAWKTKPLLLGACAAWAAVASEEPLLTFFFVIFFFLGIYYSI